MWLGTHRWTRCGLLLSIAAAAASCGGSSEGGGDDDDCAGGVCLPTGTPGDSSGDDGADTGAGDDAAGCNPANCDPWRVADPPDGTAVRSCNDSECAETVALPDLDENYFRCRVEPIFDMGCGFMGCHSPVTPARELQLFVRGQWREGPIRPGAAVEGPGHPTTCQTVMCGPNPLTAMEWQNNFDAARLFAIELEDATDSELLSQPLAGDALGHDHDGIDMFQSPSDVRYQAIAAWLDGATDDPTCGGGIPLPAWGGPIPEGTTTTTFNDFGCPSCRVNNMCPGTPSGETSPCDPSACLP